MLVKESKKGAETATNHTMDYLTNISYPALPRLKYNQESL